MRRRQDKSRKAIKEFATINVAGMLHYFMLYVKIVVKVSLPRWSLGDLIDIFDQQFSS